MERLIGKTLMAVRKGKMGENESLMMLFEDGSVWQLVHIQNCCEHVRIEDVCGDFQDLIGSPLLESERRTKRGDDSEESSSTWTFFHLGGIKGRVTVRFYGTSNGYYSEDAILIKKGDDEDEWLHRDTMIPDHQARWACGEWNVQEPEPVENLIFFQANEEHFYNAEAVAITLYFERKPTDEEMKQIIRRIHGDEESYDWWEDPTPVSKRAGLVRIQIPYE